MIFSRLATKDDGPFVYFIQATLERDGVKTDIVKIGTTAYCPIKRMNELASNVPMPLHILAVIPFASYDREKRLHYQFASKRLHGEWFTLDDELESFILRNAVEYEPWANVYTDDEFRQGVNYAIEQSGIGELAAHLDLPTSTLQAWANGDHTPTKHGKQHVINVASAFRIDQRSKPPEDRLERSSGENVQSTVPCRGNASTGTPGAF